MMVVCRIAFTIFFKGYNGVIMKNVDLLKKVAPLLRENEEVVCIPPKCRSQFIHIISLFLFCVFIVSPILMYVRTLNGQNLSVLLVCFFSTILPLYTIVIILFFATYLSSKIVITNQRVICFRFWKNFCIERDDIIQVSECPFNSNERGYKTLLIKTKDNKSYKFEFYDYKQIKEQLGL